MYLSGIINAEEEKKWKPFGQCFFCVLLLLLCVCQHVHAMAHMRRTKDKLGCLPLPSNLFDKGSHVCCCICQASHPSNMWDSTVSTSHLQAIGKQGLQNTLPHLHLRGPGEQSPDPHLLTTSALPFVPSP